MMWVLAYVVALLLSPNVSAGDSNPKDYRASLDRDSNPKDYRASLDRDSNPKDYRASLDRDIKRSFVEEGFQRGQSLLESEKWQRIEDGLWWHTFREYSVWPYFMYSVCTKVPIDNQENKHRLYKRNVIVDNALCTTLLDIEVYHYPQCSKHWIFQLLRGYQEDTSTQYLEYNFFPFPNRGVCQTYHLHQSALWTSLDGNVVNPNASSSLEESILQVFIETTTPLQEENVRMKESGRGCMKTFINSFIRMSMKKANLAIV
jgi:hypothetical protein